MAVPPKPGKPRLPHLSPNNPRAPGTPKGPPVSGKQPGLTPKPKPSGPAKGGPPPFGTKPIKSWASAITKAERMKRPDGTPVGHGDSEHRRVGQQPSPLARPNKQNIGVRASNEGKTITAPGSPQDKTRMVRAMNKSPELKKAQQALATGPVNTRGFVAVPTPGPRAPVMQSAAPKPGGKPAITNVRASEVRVPLIKTPRGVVPISMHGSQKPTKK